MLATLLEKCEYEYLVFVTLKNTGADFLTPDQYRLLENNLNYNEILEGFLDNPQMSHSLVTREAEKISCSRKEGGGFFSIEIGASFHIFQKAHTDSRVLKILSNLSVSEYEIENRELPQLNAPADLHICWGPWDHLMNFRERLKTAGIDTYTSALPSGERSFLAIADRTQLRSLEDQEITVLPANEYKIKSDECVVTFSLKSMAHSPEPDRLKSACELGRFSFPVGTKRWGLVVRERECASISTTIRKMGFLVFTPFKRQPKEPAIPPPSPPPTPDMIISGFPLNHCIDPHMLFITNSGLLGNTSAGVNPFVYSLNIFGKLTQEIVQHLETYFSGTGLTLSAHYPDKETTWKKIQDQVQVCRPATSTTLVVSPDLPPFSPVRGALSIPSIPLFVPIGELLKVLNTGAGEHKIVWTVGSEKTLAYSLQGHTDFVQAECLTRLRHALSGLPIKLELMAHEGPREG